MVFGDAGGRNDDVGSLRRAREFGVIGGDVQIDAELGAPAHGRRCVVSSAAMT